MVRLVSVACIALLFSTWHTQEATGNPVAVAVEAVKMGYEAYQVVQKIREYLKPEASFDDQLTEKELMVFDKLDNIATNIQELENRLNERLSKDLYDKYSARTKDMYETINYVDGLYEKLLLFTRNRNLIDWETMDSFTKSALGYDFDQVESRIQRLHDSFIKEDSKGESLLDLLSDRDQTELMCIRGQPPQQVIWETYTAIVATDLKAFTLKLVSRQIRKNTTSTDFVAELELDHFKSRIEKTYKQTVRHMTYASRELWKCDPRSFYNGTYDKLEQVFQVMITNERDTSLDTCKFGQCSEMNTHESGRLSYASNTVFSQLTHMAREKLQCSGHVVDCRSTSARFEYCVADPEDDRRYEGIYTSQAYGDYSEDCDLYNYDVEVDRLSLIKWQAYTCQFCLCTCASNKLNIDRYFSLTPVTSNLNENMVITGVRLKKSNHVFYMEIQEGRLIGNATIDKSTVRDRKIRPRKVDFEKIYRENKKNKYGDFPVNDKVFAVHWEQKKVFLDDLKFESPDEDFPFVLTGLQFVQHDDALKLQIRLSPFNYDTGEIADDGNWYSNNKDKNQRRKFKPYKPDHPIKKKGHVLDSKSYHYIEFGVTDMKANMGQYTVPFLDTQEVITNPPMPLAGAGLYHKGLISGGSGGFLGLKLIQYDISQSL